MILTALPFTGKGQKVEIDNAVQRYYEEALQYMKKKDYEKANLAFRKALSTNKILPTDLTYHFAETLYQLGQFQNSLNFVEKYLSLSNAGDDFYEDAISLKNDLEGEFNAIQVCQRCNVFGYRYLQCKECDENGNLVAGCYNCKGNGLTMCRKCYGKGVTITVNSFNQEVYQGCDQCSGDGFETCPVCEGETEVSQVCTFCLGSKRRISSIICDHQASSDTLNTVPYKKF